MLFNCQLHSALKIIHDVDPVLLHFELRMLIPIALDVTLTGEPGQCPAPRPSLATCAGAACRSDPTSSEPSSKARAKGDSDAGSGTLLQIYTAAGVGGEAGVTVPGCINIRLTATLARSGEMCSYDR